MISSILISRSFGSIKIITLGLYLTNNKFIPKVGFVKLPYSLNSSLMMMSIIEPSEPIPETNN